MRFYYSADWTMKHLHEPNILLSFGTIYNKGTIRKTEISRRCRSLFLDNGAYSMRLGDYPFEAFYDWVYSLLPHLPVDYVATVDRFGDMETTIKFTEKCMSDNPKIPWLPVVQGASVKEYVDCCKDYIDTGIVEDHIAVGGLKGMSKHLKRRVLNSILDEMGHLEIHGFGINLMDLRDPVIYHSLTSADSASWKRRPQTNEEKYNNLEIFKRDLKNIQELHASQQTLEVS